MILVNVLQALASFYVLSVGLVALNRMSHRTAHSIRLAYIILTAGAVAVLASALGAGNIFECAFTTGIALLLAVDRRKHRKAHQ